MNKTYPTIHSLTLDNADNLLNGSAD